MERLTENQERNLWKLSIQKAKGMVFTVQEAANKLGLGVLREDAREQREAGYVAGYQDGFKDCYNKVEIIPDVRKP